MPTVEERLARLEEMAAGIRDDVHELGAESQRNRKRLHDLEGTTSALVQRQRARDRREAENQRKLRLRLELLSLLVLVAGVIAPLVYHGGH